MKYKVTLLALLLLLSISCSKDAGKQSDANALAHQGIQNLQAAYETALLIKDNIIESEQTIEPDEKDKLLADYRKAMELGKNQFKQAVALYEEAIKNNPEDAFILNNLGHSYMWLNQYDKAQQYFDQALQYCEDKSLKSSIEINKEYFPQVEKYYDLFQEVDSHIQ